MTIDAPLTIRGKMDGFGAQLMAILSGIAYCRHHGIPYFHTPIQHLLPVGTFATNMDDQVESANAFVDSIIGRLGLDRKHPPVTHAALHMHDEINASPDTYYTPEFTRYLARAYQEPTPNEFVGHEINVAVHVRRGDIVKEETYRWVELEEVNMQMNRLRDRYNGAQFHVFSWMDPCHGIEDEDVTVYCSQSGKDFLHDFHCFVQADALIIGASCLSMSAALFNADVVIAPTMNRARTNWANHCIPSRWYR